MPFLRSSKLGTSVLVLIGLLHCGTAFAQNARQLVEQGINLHNQRRYEEAVRKFEQARAKAPNLTRILILLGSAHLQLAHLEQAMRFYEGFQQAQGTPDADEQALLRDGYDEGARRLEQEAGRSPQRPELLLLAGRARFRIGQLERANDLYQRCVKVAPTLDEPWRQVRDQYLREYHEEVLRSIPARTQQGTEPPELMLLLADSYLTLGQDEAALNTADRYRDDSRRKTPAGIQRLTAAYQYLLTRFPATTGPSILLRGRSYFGLNQLQPATDHYSQFRRENPTPPQPYAERLVRYEADLQEAQAREKAEAERRNQKSVQSSAEPSPRSSAHRWMLGLGVAGMGVGAGLLALGATGIAYNGRCIDDTKPCDRVYDSMNMGIGVTVTGVVLLVGGAALTGLGGSYYRQARKP